MKCQAFVCDLVTMVTPCGNALISTLRYHIQAFVLAAVYLMPCYVSADSWLELPLGS